MNEFTDLILRAKAQLPPGASYAGDVSAKEAWAILQANPLALLVDVRTPQEWRETGTPDLAAGMDQPLYLTWQNDPAAFVADLKRTQPEADIAAPILFLCRIGGRSAQAAQAAADHGFVHAFNIAHGFEGDPDPSGERGHLNGWKADGLPWSRAA